MTSADRAPVTTVGTTCPACAGPVSTADRFCEACGAELRAGASASAPVVPARGCAVCGGAVGADGLCQECGARAPSERDHVTQEPASWVAGVCDRGLHHPRNEDAMALQAGREPGSSAVLVVCDGVSSSTGSDVASLAAARAACDVLAVSRPQGLGTAATRIGAKTKAIEAAVDAANDAVIAHTPSTRANPASCTLVAAVLDGSLLVVGSVGDSRAYWLPDEGAARLLTVDDSFAAEQIAAGVPRADAENGPHAHAITRWLGVDAPDHTPRVASLDLTVPGWLLVCSDGLWNYCSDPGDLAVLLERTTTLSGPAPLDVAKALVSWANAQGGRDNITVALARVGSSTRKDVRPDGNLLS